MPNLPVTMNRRPFGGTTPPKLRLPFFVSSQIKSGENRIASLPVRIQGKLCSSRGIKTSKYGHLLFMPSRSALLDLMVRLNLMVFIFEPRNELNLFRQEIYFPPPFNCQRDKFQGRNLSYPIARVIDLPCSKVEQNRLPSFCLRMFIG